MTRIAELGKKGPQPLVLCRRARLVPNQAAQGKTKRPLRPLLGAAPGGDCPIVAIEIPGYEWYRFETSESGH
jgi:hypothetical protein